MGPDQTDRCGGQRKKRSTSRVRNMRDMYPEVLAEGVAGAELDGIILLISPSAHPRAHHGPHRGPMATKQQLCPRSVHDGVLEMRYDSGEDTASSSSGTVPLCCPRGRKCRDYSRRRRNSRRHRLASSGPSVRTFRPYPAKRDMPATCPQHARRVPDIWDIGDPLCS